MSWTTPFIVYRIDEGGDLIEVAYPADLTKAKYWIKYIAHPGDVCCRTPAHPKHSAKEPRPEYFTHKAASGTAVTNESEWRDYALSRNFESPFPDAQLGVPREI